MSASPRRPRKSLGARAQRGRRQDLADDVEHRVIIQRVTNLLELLQQALKHAAFNRIGRDEIEDETIEKLAVTMDAAHALFQPIGIPRDIVVKKDMAALEVDALAGGFCRNENLNRSVLELLLGIEPAVRLFPRAGLHAAVNETDPKAPVFKDLNEVIKRVFELSEDKESLIRVVKKSLLVEKIF